MAKKQKNQGRKVGRNRVKAASYKARHLHERNRVKKLVRHMKQTKGRDKVALDALGQARLAALMPATRVTL